MDNTYGEFEGTELDPSTDLDSEFDEEQNDLISILSLSAVVAAIVGAILVLIGRRRKRTPQERAQEILDDAGKRVGKGVKAAAQAVGGTGLADLLQEAIGKAYDAAGNVPVGDVIGEVGKKARKAGKDMDLSSLLADATDRASKAARNFDLQDVTKSAKKGAARVADVASSASISDVDTKGVEGLLDMLKHRLSDAIDSVRGDIAPGAADRLKSDILPAAQGMVEDLTRRVREDVMPAAQDAVGKVREDVIPNVQERASKMADDADVAPRARKAASAAMHGAGSLADVMRGVGMAVMAKVVEEMLPGAKKAGGTAFRAARDEVIPTAAHTAGDAVERVRDDVLPKVGDIAGQAPDVLSSALRMAINKVEGAMGKAQPVASDAIEYGRHRAREAAEFSLHRAQDVTSGVRGAGSGVGGALSTAGHGVTDAVGTAVGATAHATKETTSILFWLSMLGGLIMLVFVPDREKQREIWNNMFQFMGEIREMWDDLQGVADSEPDALPDATE